MLTPRTITPKNADIPQYFIQSFNPIKIHKDNFRQKS